jgi:hypothetical protein
MEMKLIRRSLHNCLCLALALLGAGCAPTGDFSNLEEEANLIPSEAVETATAMAPYEPPEVYPAPVLPATREPYPGVFILESTPGPTWVPTLSGSPTPTPIPLSWAIYTHPSLPLQLRYPENWTGAPEGYSGPDGFFVLRAHTPAPSTFDDLTTLCVLEANGAGGILFGTSPKLFNWQSLKRTGQGCAVIPSSGSDLAAGGQAILYARFSPPWPADQVLELRADPAHFDGILKTLSLTGALPPTPATGDYNSPACQEEPEAEPVRVILSAGLVITETALASAGCDPWLQYDGFHEQAEPVFQNRIVFSERGRIRQMELNNEALAPFGYRLVEETQASDPYPLFVLYQGETPLVEKIKYFGPVSVNETGDDFLLWVYSAMTYNLPVEVSLDHLRPSMAESRQVYNTVWTGMQVLSYEYWNEWDRMELKAMQVKVKRGEAVVADIAVPIPDEAGYPVNGFWSWDGHWLLEVENVLFQDGEVLNTQLGYEEIFAWHPVEEQPLYFFRRGPEYGLSYAGETLPVKYEDVIHGPLCCDAGVYSIISTPQGTDFFARRDGVWYHVRVELET